MDDERWTGEDYLVWIMILVGLGGLAYVAYMLAMHLGEAVL